MHMMLEEFEGAILQYKEGEFFWLLPSAYSPTRPFKIIKIERDWIYLLCEETGETHKVYNPKKRRIRHLERVQEILGY